MWRKQPEPKAASPVPPSSQPPAAPPRPSTPSVSKAEAIVAPPVHSAPVREAAAPAGHLTKGLVVKGEIIGAEDVFVDGEVHGQIRINGGKVTVGPSGRLVASVEADDIVVRGRVKGDLHARARVQIGATGNVTGDVVTRLISVEEGAQIRGNVDTTRGEERRPQRVTPIAAAAGESRPASLPEPSKERLPAS